VAIIRLSRSMGTSQLDWALPLLPLVAEATSPDGNELTPPSTLQRSEFGGIISAGSWSIIIVSTTGFLERFFQTHTTSAIHGTFQDLSRTSRSRTK